MLNDLLNKRLAIVSLMFVIFMIAGAAGAETTSNAFADRIGSITGTKYLDYPLQFSYQGGIDRVGENEMVIDDTLIRFANGVTFNIPRLKNVPKSRIHKGDIVGLIIDSAGQISSLWTLEHGKDLAGE